MVQKIMQHCTSLIKARNIVVFLALLDFVSRATVVTLASVVRRPSVVRKFRFLGNR